MFEGTIAREPLDQNQLKALVCCCNADYGFLDQEVVDHALMHESDLVMFIGDQYYPFNGGFGKHRESTQEKAYLNYLRKWYQFGWSY